MKYYVVQLESDPGKLAVIGASGFVPKNAIAQVPIDPLTGQAEEAEWLEIFYLEELSQNIVTVNRKLKRDILSARRDLKKAAEEQREVLRQKKQEFKAAIKSLKENEVEDLESIRQAIKLLAEAVEELVKD